MAKARTTTTRRSARRKVALPLGLSTKRAAVLAVVVCALALTLAFPLRTYLGQRQQLADTAAQRATLSSQVAQLEQQRAQLNDPAYIQAQARERLRYVMPGQTPYQVQLPGGLQKTSSTPPAAASDSGGWYSNLWAALNNPAANEPAANEPAGR